MAAFAGDLETSPDLVDAVREQLAGGLDVACWCRPEAGPCHGDVLRRVAVGVDPVVAYWACIADHAGRLEEATALAGLSFALATLPGPAAAVDGDCQIWEPQIRAAAQAAGYPVARAMMTGWIDPAATLAAFMHEVSIVTVADRHVVVDLASQQYSHSLPRRWFATESDYCARLATAAGCASVGIFPARR